MYRIFKKKKSRANLADGGITATFLEVNMLSNTVKWVVDYGATWHICTNKDICQEHEKVTEVECVFMANSSSVSISSKGNISLEPNLGEFFLFKMYFMLQTIMETLFLLTFWTRLELELESLLILLKLFL